MAARMGRPIRRGQDWAPRSEAHLCHAPGDPAATLLSDSILAASATTEATVIDLYFWQTPNGRKVSVMLEELALPYQIFPINIGRGEQFKPEFLAISPNNRIPAIVDHEPAGGGSPISVFESGAILLYLAE